MANHTTRIRTIIERMLESGELPEEACRDEPELLDAVKSQWHRLRQVEAQVDAIFPSSTGERYDRHRRFMAMTDNAAAMPTIGGYRIERLIGHGGMGAVYRAQHLKLNRPVAIKVMLAGAYASTKEFTRFLREAEAVAAVQHANIVQVYDVGEFDGRPYFTLEFIEGGTLADKLAGTPQPARDAALMTATLARAVHVAHKAGIVHRDLKPSNILLTADGSPKIADFGLAQRFEGGGTISLDGAVVGSPSYMAPEQAAGTAGAFCPMVDIYALGAILYEMLTGRPPFRADTASETQRQVMHEEPAPPCKLNVKVPRDLETICMKCLRKQPRMRYASAADMADDLDRFLNNEPIHARPISRLERLVRRAKRNPTATMLIVAIVLLGTVAIVAGMREWNRAVERQSERARIHERMNDGFTHLRSGRLHEARLLLEGLTGQGDDAGDDANAIAAALKELDLLESLERIRIDRSSAKQERFDKLTYQHRYESAFATAGMNVLTDPTQSLAQHVREYHTTHPIIVALDDWALCSTELESCSKILELTKAIDPDPWRDQVRNPVVWSNSAMLATLAEQADVMQQPVPLMLILASLLDATSSVESVALMRRVQRSHADDFWATFLLAELLDGRDEEDALGFYRAAISIRPDAIAAHVNLANMLARRGRLNESKEHFARALAVDDHVSLTHFNMAVTFLNAGDNGLAVAHAQRATELDPAYGQAYAVLGCALEALERRDQAIAAFEQSLTTLEAQEYWRTVAEAAMTRLR